MSTWKPSAPDWHALNDQCYDLLLLEDDPGDADLVQEELAVYAPGSFAITRAVRLADALDGILAADTATGKFLIATATRATPRRISMEMWCEGPGA